MFLEWGKFNQIRIGDQFYIQWEGEQRTAEITAITTSVANSMKGARPEAYYDLYIRLGSTLIEESFMTHKELIKTLTGEK